MKQTDQTRHENQWPTHGSEHPSLPFVPRTDQDKYIAQKNKNKNKKPQQTEHKNQGPLPKQLFIQKL